MQTLAQPPADLLTQQGITALQANDKARAHDLLGKALHIEPHNEQAWLWLSGAVQSDAERRYCLERVLVLNPHNTAAQRGIAILPATLPVSPFPEQAPPAAPALEPTPALAAPPAGPAPRTESLLDIIAQPDAPTTPAPSTLSAGPPSIELKSRFFADPAAEEPVVETFVPAPITAPPVADTGGTSTGGYDPHVVEFVVREYGRHRSRDEIIRALSEQHYLAWGDAHELMAQIERDHGRKIALRQSPFFIILGVIAIIGGCILMARSGYYLYGIYSRGTQLSGIAAISTPRSLVYLCVQLVTGLAMVLGATIGLGQTIKGLFK
jgi:hypothetical protein